MFFVSRARVNIAKKQFSNVNNEYEITFENTTEIDPVRRWFVARRWRLADGITFSVTTRQCPRSNTTSRESAIWGSCRRTNSAVCLKRHSWEIMTDEVLLDVIGVVKEVHELGSVTSKATNKPVSWLMTSFLP